MMLCFTINFHKCSYFPSKIIGKLDCLIVNLKGNLIYLKELIFDIVKNDCRLINFSRFPVKISFISLK